MWSPDTCSSIAKRAPKSSAPCTARNVGIEARIIGAIRKTGRFSLGAAEKGGTSGWKWACGGALWPAPTRAPLLPDSCRRTNAPAVPFPTRAPLLPGSCPGTSPRHRRALKSEWSDPTDGPEPSNCPPATGKWDRADRLPEAARPAATNVAKRARHQLAAMRRRGTLRTGRGRPAEPTRPCSGPGSAVEEGSHGSRTIATFGTRVGMEDAVPWRA